MSSIDDPSLDGPSIDDPSFEPGEELKRRRAPRYGRFVATGLILGALLGVVLALPAQGYTGSLILYLGIPLALVGALIGAGLALRAESRWSPRGAGSR